MEASKLNIHFHNPNSAEDTYKIVSEVFANLCVKKIKQIIIDDNNDSDTLTDNYNFASSENYS